MENPKLSAGLGGRLGAPRAERSAQSLSEGQILSATWGYGGFGPKLERIEIVTFNGADPDQKLRFRLPVREDLGSKLGDDFVLLLLLAAQHCSSLIIRL